MQPTPRRSNAPTAPAPESRGTLHALTACAVAAALMVMAGCASSPSVDLDATPAELYREMVGDMERQRGAAGIFEDATERAEQRFAEIVRRVDDGELESAEDHFHAGAILVRSSRMEHLLLAESLGRRAVILGDERGKPVAGEAIDRQALISGAPQPFGTQYAYNAVTGNWQLYQVDDEVTDAERASMGLPPLSWFKDRVRQLNDSARTRDLRDELGLPPIQDTLPGGPTDK